MLRVNPLPRTEVAQRLFDALTRTAALLVPALLVGVVLSLLLGAWPAMREYGLGFVGSDVWDPVQGRYGALAMVGGTLATSALALLLAVPLGFGIALFLVELASEWLRAVLGAAMELLATVPSIVYGMWGLMVFGPFLAALVHQPLQALWANVPLLQSLFVGPPVGIGIAPAAIVLAMMVTPLIAAVMRDSLQAAPAQIKESARALGATTWEVVWHVVLPQARYALWGAIMLGLGRALGETMAVTFVIGNMNQWDGVSLFTAASSITSVIANEFAEAEDGLHRAALMYLGLLLFAIALVVQALSHLVRREAT